MPNKKTVAVLMGGLSPEREISLLSGQAVLRALRKSNNSVVEIVVNDYLVNEIDDHDIDVAFIALHGCFGEDGGIQEVLESKRIPYTGSGVSASRLAMDKVKSKNAFKIANIQTPDYCAVPMKLGMSEIIERVEKIILPVVVKPIGAGSSVGISLIKEYDELREGVSNARLYDEQILIEKFIEGRELTVGILNDLPLPIIEIKSESLFYDYDAKYRDKRTQYITLKSADKLSESSLPHALYARVQELAMGAHKSLGCRDFSRVDLILNKEGDIYVLEVNTIPGFTERSLLPKAASAQGVGFVELCNAIVKNALRPTVEDLSAVCS
ncbi:MAG: D-alanine--D-alanine ligase [Candidatus Scalindua sp. AMX11]|nr:MAG: D-alanine--D-alanine ligase [Candidatus Scalindua sp.]NOG85609.1 D-alanine--D-alanine ligase [Planctomycetota bacterium]RZV65375.1 MAG: D-alanine--D-alanine ligase [Candidatus Scalindua sp. SCAELEC01]TDE63471.1 MAG: D-alanine--D-alanine ligase [Candidatus Scalindua sp. AMX11]GJQ57289.1 MAG: D-alanine--D-alanine ligase [Candidatus Scalindua sp.]